MIGERLESHRNLPWVALLLLAAGIGLAVAGLSSGINAMVTGAVLPLALAGSLWFLGQEQPLTAMFREDGLEIENAGEPILVPYASIQNIQVGGRMTDPGRFRKSSYPIAVLHERGLVRIPSRLNFPSHEVYRFLSERVSEGGRSNVSPVLAEYLERQVEYFGPKSVATFRAASRRVTGARLGYRACCVGIMIAGGAWSALGFSGFSATEWGAAGILCLLSGAILYAASFPEALPTRPMKNWKNASLVIGPQGMAMDQGDIQGELRWPELVEIRLNTKPSSFNLGNPSAMLPGILLRVKGAKILIADIYDRPLFVIYNRILVSSGRSAPLDLE